MDYGEPSDRRCANDDGGCEGAGARRGRQAPLHVGRQHAGLRGLSRPRMGPAGRRRFAPVREDLPGRLPVRPVVADDPQEAREFPQRLCRLRLHRVARFKDKDVARLLADAGIVRHRGKIESTINNAARAIELEKEAGSLAAYFWRFEPDEDAPKNSTGRRCAMPTTPELIALSKDLKKRGWTFVGPTTVYAFMQAMGLVNDHLDGCYCRVEVERERKAFVDRSEERSRGDDEPVRRRPTHALPAFMHGRWASVRCDRACRLGALSRADVGTSMPAIGLPRGRSSARAMRKRRQAPEYEKGGFSPPFEASVCLSA